MSTEQNDPRFEEAVQLVGETIGGVYEIESLIAPGGMSNVYKGKHKHLGKEYAIKVLLKDATDDPILMARFKREAKLVSKLNHPNICAIIEYLVDSSGIPIIVMEYLDGCSLDITIEHNEFLSPVDTVKICMSICKALSFAHELGVVHRDIKPANVILLGDIDGKYDVKLVDFGIAKTLNHNTMSTKLTRTGEVFGTPLYLSPEQCLDQPIDHRSDIYSLGCMMYTMLSGWPPFIDVNPIEVMKMHLSTPIDFEETPIKRSLAEIIIKATDKKQENRYQSADEFYEALRANEFCRIK